MNVMEINWYLDTTAIYGIQIHNLSYTISPFSNVLNNPWVIFSILEMPVADP